MSAKIAAALHEVMSKVSYVQKTGNNKFHGYKYAGEADLLEKLRPAMLEAGLLLIPSVVSVTPTDEHGNTTVRMEYTLVHKDGDVWPTPIGAAGTGNDKNSKGGVGDKGTYKAITGANKYLLFKLFQIETGDDPEQSEEPAPRPVAVAPRKTAEPAPEAPPPGPVSQAAVSAEARQKLMGLMMKATTRTTLRNWADGPKVQAAIEGLTDKDRTMFDAEFQKRWTALPESLAMAG